LNTAAPQVAGLIATYLSYDSKPWDDSKQGIERVKAIRDYLVSDRSSWERQPGIRMIWNGAGENEHRSASGNSISTPSAAPEPTVKPTPSASSLPKPTKALSVILQRQNVGQFTFGTFDRNYENKWLFFETDVGVAPGCRLEKESLANPEAGIGAQMIYDAPWPSITQSLKIDGMECEYKNDGQNPGALWCQGRKEAITCYEEKAKASGEEPAFCSNDGSSERRRKPIAYCE
jgi:hypothetical protein